MVTLHVLQIQDCICSDRPHPLDHNCDNLPRRLAVYKSTTSNVLKMIQYGDYKEEYETDLSQFDNNIGSVIQKTTTHIATNTLPVNNDNMSGLMPPKQNDVSDYDDHEYSQAINMMVATVLEAAELVSGQITPLPQAQANAKMCPINKKCKRKHHNVSSNPIGVLTRSMKKHMHSGIAVNHLAI